MGMSPTRKAAAIAVAAAAATSVLAAGMIVPALAQEAGRSDTSTSEPNDDTRAMSRSERREANHEAFIDALAAELGLDTGTVADAVETVREATRAEQEAARQTAREERLADAVEAGELTREQADAILEGHEAGVVPFGRHDGPDGRHGPGARGGRSGSRGPCGFDPDAAG